MRKIQPLFGQINLIQRQQGNPDWYQPHTNDEVLQQPPIPVATYNQLITHIAPLQHYNRNITLFYRGQTTDRQKDGMTQLLPSIFRLYKGETRLLLKQRFALLMLFDTMFIQASDYEPEVSGLPDSAMYVSIPGSKWEAVVRQVAQTLTANQAISDYHTGRKQQFQTDPSS